MTRIVVDFPAPFGPKKPGDPAWLGGKSEPLDCDGGAIAVGQLVTIDHDRALLF